MGRTKNIFNDPIDRHLDFYSMACFPHNILSPLLVTITVISQWEKVSGFTMNKTVGIGTIWNNTLQRHQTITGGRYRFIANYSLRDTGASQPEIQVGISFNGVDPIAANVESVASGSNWAVATLIRDFNVVRNDTIELFVRNDSTTDNVEFADIFMVIDLKNFD